MDNSSNFIIDKEKQSIQEKERKKYEEETGKKLNREDNMNIFDWLFYIGFPLGFVVDENENLILEDHHSDTETISFSDIGDLRFEDILKPNKLILEQGENTDSDFHFSQVILLEDDVDGNAEKNQLLLEETGRFQLFENEFTKLSGSGVADQDNANAI